jgi:hypothetical protein
LVGFNAAAQTAGTAKLETTILDYTGDTVPDHWTAAWVTTESGQFIKTLRKQGGPSWTSTHWGSHLKTWNDARGGSATGSQVVDGYTSATAYDYAGTNSPIILTWNCRDTNNVLVPDGNYKFWVQYAEDAGQGPHTTNGMLWTKGPAGVTNTYANLGSHFSGRKVAWTPSAPVSVAPTITSAAPTGSGTVGVAYNFSCTASGTAPITFTAPGLPNGLTMSTAGVISGIPTVEGTFNGTITAANGTLPNATQAFSIKISVVPASIGTIEFSGDKVILSGSGPANGRYTVMSTTDAASTSWTPLATNQFAANGTFRSTNTVPAGGPRTFYRLRIP